MYIILVKMVKGEGAMIHKHFSFLVDYIGKNERYP